MGQRGGAPEVSLELGSWAVGEESKLGQRTKEWEVLKIL